MTINENTLYERLRRTKQSNEITDTAYTYIDAAGLSLDDEKRQQLLNWADELISELEEDQKDLEKLQISIVLTVDRPEDNIDDLIVKEIVDSKISVSETDQIRISFYNLI